MSDLELVFQGELVEGFTLVQVRANMAKLFRATDAQLDRMFSGRPVVLKNGLDAAMAEKFRQIIGKQGAIVHIRRQGEPLPTAKAQSPAAATPAAPASTASSAAVKPGESSRPANPFFRHLDAAESGTASATAGNADTGQASAAPAAASKMPPPEHAGHRRPTPMPCRWQARRWMPFCPDWTGPWPRQAPHLANPAATSPRHARCPR
ncbi:hypothetical protein AAIA72_13670 [Hahella sp. SMD15-11]|uniref:Uncharacterized protein n=1 Tax=Thermohahella caldifontis TaxID=3142973 RepID=A0AB39UU93_9GAMM